MISTKTIKLREAPIRLVGGHHEVEASNHILWCVVCWSTSQHTIISHRIETTSSRHVRHVCNNWGLAMSIGMIQHQGGDGCGFFSGLTFSLLLVFFYTSKISPRAPPGTVPIPDHGCKPQANSESPLESIGKNTQEVHSTYAAPPPSPVLALQSIVPSSLPSFPLGFFRYRIWLSSYKMESKHSIMWRRRLSKEPQ